MVLFVTKFSRGRLFGLLMAGAVLVLVAFGGFSRFLLTDATWSDERALSATFEAEQPEVIIPGHITNPRCEAPGGPPNEVKFTWAKPTNLEDYDVVYEVSWRISGAPESKVYEVTTAQFGPYSPDLEPASPPPDLEFAVRAKIEGRGELGPAAVFWVKGPRSNGLFTCNGNVEFRALQD